jgi:hypothetical protein
MEGEEGEEMAVFRHDQMKGQDGSVRSGPRGQARPGARRGRTPRARGGAAGGRRQRVWRVEPAGK